MTDFLDLDPAPPEGGTVMLADASGELVPIAIQKITIADLAAAARKHPQLRMLFRDGAAAADANLLALEHRPAVIAAGLGHPGDARYEQKAAALSTADQQSLFEAIMRLSFPTAADAEDARPLPASAAILKEFPAPPPADLPPRSNASPPPATPPNGSGI